MKAVKIDLAGESYYLIFNGAAMFAIEEEFGGASKMLDGLGDTSDGYDKLCRAVAILAEQGELTRRYMGYEAGEVLTADTVKTMATPLDVVELKQATVKAVMLGYGRDITDDKAEVDLGLVELQQKKTRR